MATTRNLALKQQSFADAFQEAVVLMERQLREAFPAASFFVSMHDRSWLLGPGVQLHIDSHRGKNYFSQIDPHMLSGTPRILLVADSVRPRYSHQWKYTPKNFANILDIAAYQIRRTRHGVAEKRESPYSRFIAAQMAPFRQLELPAGVKISAALDGTYRIVAKGRTAEETMRLVAFLNELRAPKVDILPTHRRTSENIS